MWLVVLGFMYDVTHPVSQSVIQHAAYFEWFPTAVKHAELDLNSPCTVKIPGLRKVKGKSNQNVNRGSVNHTFPGQLCQDQLCIHHGLHDLCAQSKEEIKERREKDRNKERDRRTRSCGWAVRYDNCVVWSVTSQQPTLGFSSVPPHLPDAQPVKGVKGWQVPWGAARSFRVRFLRGQAFAVLGWRERGGGTIRLVSRAGYRRDLRAAISPNQLHLQAVTDGHVCLRWPQSAFRVFTRNP